LSVLLILSAELNDMCSRHRLLISDEVNIDTVADETSESNRNVRCLEYDEDAGERGCFGELVEYRIADSMASTRGYCPKVSTLGVVGVFI
jgi:hypothetical protein